ncbi:MAG: hypothetical protein IKM52_05505 [Clostridia bacterium]|nr:hypothetical protein [Clostridia bacterium]
MKKPNVAATVSALIEKTVEEAGCRLWDVEYVKVGAEYHLIITIDNDEGITIEDCERMHRAIDPILDEADAGESEIPSRGFLARY